MSAWEDLVSACLLGSERRSVDGLDAAVAAILGADVDAASAEERLLDAAGVLGAWRRAGWLPPRSATAPPAPAPPDARPPAPAAATQLLELLLDGQVTVAGGPTELVGEWLSRCAAAGRRPPAALLPRVLDAATAARGLRAPALAAGGPALRWLAARNPAWAWAASGAEAGDAAGADPAADLVDPADPADLVGPAGPADPETIWATGRGETRLALLSALRAREPGRARALLESTWKREPAAERARFVEALASGLSDGDEAFLETALDDRSKAVRAAAGALLSRLPSSRLAARMTERLRPLVRIGGRLRRRLEVVLPDDLDAAAARDGVTDAAAPAHVGPRAWRLTQIIAATPLAFWEELVGAPAGTIVAQHARHTELVDGWVRAATRQRNPVWARALLEHRPDPALLGALEPPEAHGALEAVLSRAGDTALPGILAAVAGPWPASTSRAVLARLRTDKTEAALAQALPLLAARLDPGVGADVESWAQPLPSDSPLRRPLHNLVRTLSIRQAITREFT